MNVPLSRHWQDFVAEAVCSGRFRSTEEVMEAGLRLVEERERKLRWLRDKVDAALAAPRRVSEEELDASLHAASERLRAAGYE